MLDFTPNWSLAKNGQIQYQDNNGDFMIYSLEDALKTFNKKEELLMNLQTEQISEMQEHQQAMKIADKKIKALEKSNDWQFQELNDCIGRLKQFYSRLGVEACDDDEIQNEAIKRLNKLISKLEKKERK